MRIEDWETCESLFHSARELQEQDRPAFLDAHCPVGSEMRRLLELLLRNDEGQDDFLIPPATEMLSTDFSGVAQEETTAPLLAGTSLGRYRLVRFLGSGAFGEVWEAEDSVSGRRVALKVLAPLRLTTSAPSADDPQLTAFYREGQLAARINHPRSVYVFGAEQIQGLPIITMELMQGGTLDDKLRATGRLEVSQAVDSILDIIEGLEAAHQVGIVHRDIKPSNCFIDDEGRARIGDFGIAMTLQSENPSPGTFAGTPAFASPEQVRGREVDARSDIYSVGATLYTLLTGKRPFEGSHPGELLARILSEPPVPFSEHGVRLPKGLTRVIERCLAKDREKRYAGYPALRKDLLPYSSAAATPGNLASRLAAFVIDEMVVMVGILGMLQAAFPGWLADGAMSLTHFLYYGLFEIVWGRTPGKYLMRLNIVDASGAVINRRQAAIRSLSFGFILLPLVVTERFLGPAILLRIATGLAYLVTMRRDNGFAGPHELLSNTRVIAGRRDETTVPEASRLPEVPDSPKSTERAKLGPFEILQQIWKEKDEALLLAFEPVLRRYVWIHTSESNDKAISDHLVSARPGKLRWLQGGRENIYWNAYEVVQGESLWARVRNRGCLTWSQTVSVLLDVTSELESRILSGERLLLSMQHIWINSSPRAAASSARILEFPAAISEGSAHGSPVDACNAKDFVYAVLAFALTGATAVNPSGRDSLTVPLPEHARTFARRLASGKQLSIGLLRQELRRLSARPADIRLPRRAAMLAATTSLPLVLALSLIAVPMMNAIRLPQWQRELERLPIYDMWSNLLEDRKTPEARDAAIAICKALAWIGQGADETAGGRRLLAQLKPFQRSRLEDCRNQYRSVTASEAAEARKVAEAYFIGRPLSSAEKDRRFAVLRQGVDVFFWGGGVLWIIPVVLSAVFPPGLCGRAMGVSLQTMSGQAPTATRRVLRSICVWFPFVVFYPLLLTAAYLGYAPSATAYWKKEGFLAATLQLHGYSGILGTVDVLLLGLFGLGIIFALAKPHRGLPDFIAGTCLVPK